MANVTLRLRHDPKTGKRDLIVELDSDEELLHHEHEKDHRRLVEKLIGRPISDLGDDIGEVKILRVEPKGEATGAPDAAADAAQRPTPEGAANG